MAAYGQVFTGWQWRRPGLRHRCPRLQFLSSALNSSLPNPLQRSAPVGYSSESAGSFAPTASAHRIYRQEQYSPWYHLPIAAIQLWHCCPSRAQQHHLFFQRLKAKENETIEPHVWNTVGLSRRVDLRKSALVRTSAVAPGFVSPDGTSNSTRTEHVEQLEEIYLEKEFLFVDETWGAPGKDDEGAGGISPSVKEKLSSLLAAGKVQRGSRVLVWGGSAALAEELCGATSPASLVVTHFSISVLGAVKEMNDDVTCWLGDIEDLPHSYGPFDSVFLNSVIATAYSPDLLRDVASLCNPGARIVISYAHGRKDLAACRDKNPQLVLQDLPDATDLERMINPLPVNLVELQDEPSVYLATLEVKGTSRGLHTGNGSGEVSANISPDELPRDFLELPKGVYYGWAQQDGGDEFDSGVHKMVMNIGNRPTFADGEGVTVEAHILHFFSNDFYGTELRIIVLGFIREEMQFSSLGDLVERINVDITTAEKLLDQVEMLQYASDAFFVQKGG